MPTIGLTGRKTVNHLKPFDTHGQVQVFIAFPYLPWSQAPGPLGIVLSSKYLNISYNIHFLRLFHSLID